MASGSSRLVTSISAVLLLPRRSCSRSILVRGQSPRAVDSRPMVPAHALDIDQGAAALWQSLAQTAHALQRADGHRAPGR